jgi:hypothetical protein
MGKPSTPAPVDVNAQAAAQSASNIATANQQALLNNINTYSPEGSTTFTQGPNGQYSLNQSLNPELQSLFGTQSGLANTIAGAAGNQVSAGTAGVGAGDNLIQSAVNGVGSALPSGGLNFSRLPPLPSSANDYSSEVNNAANAAYNTQEGYLQPQQAEQTSNLAQSLADQGIPLGSAAYDRAQGDLSRSQTFANQQAQNSAVTAGNQEQQTLFGEQLGANQQGAAQAEAQYAAPVSALSSILQSGEGLVGEGQNTLTGLNPLANFQWAGTLPTFGGSPTTVTPTNLAFLQSSANTANQNAYADQTQQYNQKMNGLGSILGIGGTAAGSGGLGALLGLL